MSYKSTNYIFAHPFEPNLGSTPGFFEYPTFEGDSSVNFSDIKMWQQIFYKAGLIGVYAAYTPKAEIYMITYNMFIKKQKGYEVFSGKDAISQVINRCRSIGVELEKTIVAAN